LLGWTLLVIGRVLLFGALLVGADARFLATSPNRSLVFHGSGWAVWGLAIALLALGSLAEANGRRFRITGRRHLVADARQLLADDSRPPVLYLRSFAVDDVTSGTSTLRLSGLGTTAPVTEEEQVVRALAPVGPVVAIGQPGEALPRLGAARIYVGDDWQRVVVQLMGRARLVVLGAGFSRGLLWELDQARRLVAPERIVLLSTLAPAEYERFRVVAAQHLPVPLPAYPPDLPLVHEIAIKGAVYFEPDWTPQIVRFDAGLRNSNPHSPVEVGFVHWLRPVYERAGVPWPGLTLRVPFRLYLTRRQLRLGCLGMLALPLVALVAMALFRLLALI
jgi:hypothetical protein